MLLHNKMKEPFQAVKYVGNCTPGRENPYIDI